MASALPFPQLVSSGSTMPSHDAETTWRTAQRRAKWKRRLLPLFGAFSLLFFWWALVTFFDVKPFIAPAPQVVAATLIQKHDVLLSNLWPTAIEAVAGFLIGNLLAIAIATLFVHRKNIEMAFLPIVVLIN